MIRGLGPKASFQMNVSKDGYAPLIGHVTVTDDGATYHVLRGVDLQDKKPAKILTVILRRAGWIEGEAIDADTGKPVHLDKVVVCNFERKPNGEVVLRGCRSDFEQTQPGRFRASFPTPDEYHLTFTAAGYHDAEAYSPKVTELKTVGGIVARMKKKTDGSTPTIVPQSISGTVSREGRPVQSGWVGLWALRRPRNTVNSPSNAGTYRRGRADCLRQRSHSRRILSSRRAIPERGLVRRRRRARPRAHAGWAGLDRSEGSEEARHHLHPGGRIRGRVKDIPAGWEGHVWVVAFSKTAVQAEVRVEPGGQFTLPSLPPGEYGLKAGHDAYDDAEVYPGKLAIEHPESFKETADPWKCAKLVTVKPGGDSDMVEVEFPR